MSLGLSVSARRPNQTGNFRSGFRRFSGLAKHDRPRFEPNAVGMGVEITITQEMALVHSVIFSRLTPIRRAERPYALRFFMLTGSSAGAKWFRLESFFIANERFVKRR